MGSSVRWYDAHRKESDRCGIGNAMILTVWRHGAAQDGEIDRQRELTDSGCDDIGFACRQFHKACRDRAIALPTAILYSPWVRTSQTAEIIAAAYTRASCKAEPALQPGSRATAVDQALAEMAFAESAHVLLVSHQPLVSHLVDQYLGDGGKVPGLSPGGLVTLSFDILAPSCGQLLFWALPPEYEVGI